MKTYQEFHESSGEDDISPQELNKLEKSLDKLFAKFKIDVEFTKHFFDRLNDSRNKKQITVKELEKIFMSTFEKFGKKMSKVGGGNDIEELIKSISTDINIPIVLKYNRNKKEVELITKTIMRKKNFKTKDKIIKVD